MDKHRRKKLCTCGLIESSSCRKKKSIKQIINIDILTQETKTYIQKENRHEEAQDQFIEENRCESYRK